VGRRLHPEQGQTLPEGRHSDLRLRRTPDADRQLQRDLHLRRRQRPVLDANNNATSATTTISGLEQYRRALLNLPGGNPTQYSSVTGDPKIDFTEFYPVFFVQDDIKLRPDLTLSAGLRYFYANRPFQDNGFTPRLGVSWAPGGSKTLKLNAHLGLFSGHSPNGLQGTQAELLREDGTARVTSLVYNAVYGDPATSGSSVIHAIRTLAPNYKSNQNLMAQIGADKTLPFGFTLQHQPHLHPRLAPGAHAQRQLTPQRLAHRPAPRSSQSRCPSAPELSQHCRRHRVRRHWQPEAEGVQFFVGAVRIHILTDADDDAFFTPQSSSTNAASTRLRAVTRFGRTSQTSRSTCRRSNRLNSNYYGNGNSPFNITTGFDNNGDGNFNDRPQFALPGQAGAVATPFGNLVATGGTGVLARNRASLPWNFHVDGNIQRVFTLTRNPKADHQQTLTANIRSSNLLNHTNVTAEGGVLGSPLFLVPYAADNSRRIEGGLRYSF
jgi:hypothetical protein